MHGRISLSTISGFLGNRLDNSATSKLEQLPIELLAQIFAFIDTEGLYPSCFLLSRTCLKAVKDDIIWEQRCFLNLQVSERVDQSHSWMQTFRGSPFICISYFYFYYLLTLSESMLFWDPEERTKSAAERKELSSKDISIIEGLFLVSSVTLGKDLQDIQKGANLILNRRYVGSFGDEYVSPSRDTYFLILPPPPLSLLSLLFHHASSLPLAIPLPSPLLFYFNTLPLAIPLSSPPPPSLSLFYVTNTL